MLIKTIDIWGYLESRGLYMASENVLAVCVFTFVTLNMSPKREHRRRIIQVT